MFLSLLIIPSEKVDRIELETTLIVYRAVSVPNMLVNFLYTEQMLSYVISVSDEKCWKMCCV